MKMIFRLWLFVFVLAALFLAAAPRLTKAATAVQCGADPSTAVLGTKITITCTGFDPDTIVNTYTVDPTGYTLWGNENYSACVMNDQGLSGQSAKTHENGSVTFFWYTQNGVNTCPFTNYSGYSNQIGPYAFVVQELDGVGGIKYRANVRVTLYGRADTYAGAQVAASNVVYPGTVNLAGSGFAPNEAVNVWFTRPANCSGHSGVIWTGLGAFNPTRWGLLTGVSGPETVTADESGNIAASYVFGSPARADSPCVGTWSVTARALGSGKGATGTFLVSGNTVANNASLVTEETSVPSFGQTYGPLHFSGIGVHVRGSGFPAGSSVNCWYTRPDGSAYRALNNTDTGFATIAVDAGGSFKDLVVSYTTNPIQGEQLGRWAITCGTPDKQYSATAWFWVVGLLDP